MITFMLGLVACSDYSFDEGKPFNPGQDEEEEEKKDAKKKTVQVYALCEASWRPFVD